MTRYPEAESVGEVVKAAQHIVVIQADNPDADSLASALALEQILGDMGKTVSLYCGVDLPSYLRYLEGSDRVSSEMPHQFDASIIVDTSSITLLAQLVKSGAKGWIAAKPSIVIDHHATKPTIDFAKVSLVHKAVATSEIIYELTKQLSWPLNPQAQKLIAIAMLSDSLGLMSSSTSARSIHIIGELVEQGVDLSEIDNARRETMRREPELVHYKGRLLERVEFYSDNRIAMVTIPWEEIETYSPLYNPPMLVLDDMRLARGTDVAIAFKLYTDGRMTAKIRCNYKKAIADKLAEHFGGGGHPYAAGFKITDGRSYEEIKTGAIEVATRLLDELAKG
jgi:bifunctional oligoribonuclease and PAP phosphatase NrnA